MAGRELASQPATWGWPWPWVLSSSSRPFAWGLSSSEQPFCAPACASEQQSAVLVSSCVPASERLFGPPPFSCLAWRPSSALLVSSPNCYLLSSSCQNYGDYSPQNGRDYKQTLQKTTIRKTNSRKAA